MASDRRQLHVAAALLVAGAWTLAGAAVFDYHQLDAFNGTLCGRQQLAPAARAPAPRITSSDAARAKGRLPLSYPPAGPLASRSTLEARSLKGEFPWFARLELQFAHPNENRPSLTRHCGATLIHSTYLLTSASCFVRPDLGPALVGSATAGIYSLLEPASLWQKSAIVATCTMTGFKPAPADDATADELSRPAEDVLLVELERPLAYGERVQPVCLESPRISIEPAIDSCAMAGLGVMDQTNQLPPAYLNRVLLAPCRARELELARPHQRPDQICLSSLDEAAPVAACEGDQGNGIHVRLPNGLVGLVGVLTGPAGNCSSGSSKPLLFEQFSKLKAQMDLLLSGCIGQERLRSRASCARKPWQVRRHHHRKCPRGGRRRARIEHRTIKSAGPAASRRPHTPRDVQVARQSHRSA